MQSWINIQYRNFNFKIFLINLLLQETIGPRVKTVLPVGDRVHHENVVHQETVTPLCWGNKVHRYAIVPEYPHSIELSWRFGIGLSITILINGPHLSVIVNISVTGMKESPLGSKEFNSFSLFWNKLGLEDATNWASRAKEISDDHGVHPAFKFGP